MLPVGSVKIETSSNGHVVFKKDDKYNIYKNDDTLYIPEICMWFDSIGIIEDKLFVVSYYDNDLDIIIYKLLDEDLKCINVTDDDEVIGYVYTPFVDSIGLLRILVFDDTLDIYDTIFKYVNLDGSLVTDTLLSNGSVFANKMADVQDLNKKRNILNTDGSFVLDTFVDSISKFRNDRAIVRNNGLVYIVDANGNTQSDVYTDIAGLEKYEYQVTRKIEPMYNIIDHNGCQLLDYWVDRIFKFYRYHLNIDKTTCTLTKGSLIPIYINKEDIVNITDKYIIYDDHDSKGNKIRVANRLEEE